MDDGSRDSSWEVDEVDAVGHRQRQSLFSLWQSQDQTLTACNVLFAKALKNLRLGK